MCCNSNSFIVCSLPFTFHNVKAHQSKTMINHKIYICGTLDYYAMIQWRENTIPIEMTKYGYDPLLYYKDSLMATVAIKKKKKCLSI